jgi:HAD superfamily phosphatase (TIGR01668 family)
VLSNLTPRLIVRRLQDLSLDDLAAQGLEALLLDLDNTVCPWHSDEPAPGCEEWVQSATERFKVCMVSNSIRPRRLNRVANRLGIPAVGRWGFGRKPFAGGILAALQLLEVDRRRAAMIGDQIMTDVLGGNRLGLFTVWVQPLQKQEFFGTKPSRAVERLLLRRFRRMGLMPEGS